MLHLLTIVFAPAFVPTEALRQSRPVHVRAAVLRAPPTAAMAAVDQLKIFGKDVEITEAMRDHATTKLCVPLDKFAKLINEAQDIDLNMKVEKLGVHDSEHAGRTAHSAEVTVHLKGAHKTITVSSQTDDMYTTIDDLEANLARQLRKAKERQQDLKQDRNRNSKNEMQAAVLADEPIADEE
jgi:ribosomal subunit interface protein